MLNELEFQGGYTKDPGFADDTAPSSAPVAAVSAVPVTTPTPTSTDPRSAVTAGNFDLSNFVQGTEKRGVKLSSDYGPRPPPLPGASSDHPGIDLVVPAGTAVYAPLAGTVKDVGNTPARGNYIIIAHEDKFVTHYYHLRDTPTLVKKASVARGDQIGVVGSTGNVSGKHLHFEVHESEVGEDSKLTLTRLDPIAWLKDNPTATFPVAVTDQ